MIYAGVRSPPARLVSHSSLGSPERLLGAFFCFGGVPGPGDDLGGAGP